jgi:hypothetical protein
LGRPRGGCCLVEWTCGGGGASFACGGRGGSDAGGRGRDVLADACGEGADGAADWPVQRFRLAALPAKVGRGGV